MPLRSLQRRLPLLLAAAACTAVWSGGAAAQSSASTYSYGTYNPVQAAINRDSMNAAIIRQSTGARAKTSGHASSAKSHKKRR